MIDQEEIHNQCLSDDPKERINALEKLKSNFSSIPDKQQAWNDLLRLINDEDSLVRYYVANAIDSAFYHVPDRQQAWNDLHRLTNDEDRNVRSSAASALGSVFFYVPDKQQAWDDLHRLTNDEDRNVRSSAASSLGSVFFDVPDKQQAWDDLHRLTNDEDRNVRSSAASALGSAFFDVPDKQQAWNYLLRLTNDEDSGVRSNATFELGSAFSQVPDKQQAWNDLVRLSNNEDSDVRFSATVDLSFAFSQVPDKQQAWNDLHRLSNNEDSDVRYETAKALGSVSSHILDKQQAWNDLHRLTNDVSSYVRSSSYHSLGRFSIFMASQAETDEDYKKELEKAIEFFEKAAQESKEWINPSQFCLPFYRSFHTIIFKKQEAKEEMDKYLEEAKSAIEGSKSKELLFEAVKNLAEALKEVQDLGNLSFDAKKCELDFYRKYCDRAAELMIDAEEAAPFAAITMRRGLPILDRNLKEILKEIQQKAKIAYKESKGTGTEETARAVCKEVQKWEIGSQEEMIWNVKILVSTLKSKIPDTNQNKEILNNIEKMESETVISKLFEYMIPIISAIPTTQTNVQILVTGSLNETQGAVPMNYNDGQIKPTIGIITALPKEYAAVKSIFENSGEEISFPGAGAGRIYCLGEVNSLNRNKRSLVLANAGMGTNIAATRATLLLEHFSDLKYIIMVGIAGGVPNPKLKKVDDHVRLGDIVVSNEKGVIQYDSIKTGDRENPEYRHSPRPPSSKLLEIARILEANEILGKKPWIKYIDLSLTCLGICRPPEENDKLYSSSNTCRKMPHPEDPNRIKDQPRVFLGPIGSSNMLQKDPKMRDKLRDTFGIKAIEMEASGIADATWNHEAGYLVVRGICDYCDSHKNDDWQQYAAIVAAAYTRALIESMP